MKHRLIRSCLAVSATTALISLAWAADWPMPGGNPQRNGWASSERHITKANVGTLKLLYKYQSDNQSHGPNALTTPIISGNLITYRGFKEMLMFAGSSDKVFSLDADLNQLIWETKLPYSAQPPAADSSNDTCPGGLTAPVIMAGSSSNSLHFATLASRAPAVAGVRPPRPSPYFPPLSQTIYPLLPATLTQLNAIYTVSSDGYLHILNSSTGEDLIPAIRFLAPNAKITSLNLRDNVVYATTADHCDGFQNALFAIDILSPEKTVHSFIPAQGGFEGVAGTAIGNDGTVYVQTAYAREGDAKHLYESVVALTPKELKVKDYISLSEKPVKHKVQPAGITPVVFSFTARDLIIAGGANGKLVLLDSRSLGGSDHKTPLFASPVLTTKPKKNRPAGFDGVFSTWFDVDTGLRRFYAPMFGLANTIPGVAGSPANTDAAILALELKGTSAQPELQPVWASAAPGVTRSTVIANGMLFVLSTQPPANNAALHVLDAVNGKSLYAADPATLDAAPSAGLALANGRLYVPGRNNAIYCFGIPAQQSQLFKQ